VSPTGHSAGLRGGVESTFFGEQCIRPTPLTTSRKVAIYGPREICMVEGHTQTEHEKCVTS
jgi:hypothetical protein